MVHSHRLDSSTHVARRPVTSNSQFDHSGQFLIVANQDSDSITVFSFNLTSGEIEYTVNEYRVPSPNFVCCCPTVGRDGDAAFVQHKPKLSFATKNDGLVLTDVLSLPTLLLNHDSILQNELDYARKEIDELKMQLKDNEYLFKDSKSLIARTFYV